MRSLRISALMACSLLVWAAALGLLLRAPQLQQQERQPFPDRRTMTEYPGP